MITDFDTAFLNKLKAIFSNVQYADAALTYNIAYQLAELDPAGPTQALKFPLINIFRPSGFEINKMQTFAAKQQGIEFFYSEADETSIQTRFISVRLPYQIDVYAKSHEEVNEMMQELIMFINFRGTLEVIQLNSKNWLVTETIDSVPDNTRLFEDEASATIYIEAQPIVAGVEYISEQSNYIENYEITYDNGPSEQSEFTNNDRIYHLAIVYSINNAKLLNFRNATGIVSTDIVQTIVEEEEV